MEYDIVIIGASFAGLTLAHHLPKTYKVLIIDQKRKIDAGVESTGLITEATYQLLKKFTDIERFTPNKITTISVVSPDYGKYFFSHTKEPWIYSTDTPRLVAHITETLPDNINVRLDSLFKSAHIKKGENYPVKIKYSEKGEAKEISAKFLVGADGAHSDVAKNNPNLSVNKKFLAGLEKVFHGNINFGEHSENTVYHFWFGEFSLGYGGWLSPTVIDGKKAFRVGLAKLEKGIKKLNKLDNFIEILKEKGIIEIVEHAKSIYTFGSLIPINGVLKNVHDNYTLLLGDAAGLCGAFAADGIKGAVVSGKVAAKLIPEYLEGDKKILKKYKSEINKYQKLMRYYRKQRFYRWIWDRMKRDRTFHGMYDLIENEKDHFLDQFCDSKDNAKSLSRTILTWKNLPKLIKYAVLILVDMVFPKKTRN